MRLIGNQRLVRAIVCLVMPLIGYANSVARAQLFGLTSTGELVRLNPVSGAGTLIGNTGLVHHCAAVDSGNRLLSIVSDQLIQVNTTTGAATVLLNLTGRPANYSVRGMAIDRDDAIFVILIAGTGAPPGDLLYRVNRTTGVFTAVGSVGFTGTEGLACSPFGVLYATNLTQGLLIINKTTGAASVIGGGSNQLETLEFDLATGICYGARLNLVRIDPATGLRTVIGATGFDIRGLAMVGHGAAGTGDCNSDSYVGRADFIGFTACMGGPDMAPAGTDCSCTDLDGDGDTDLADFQLFQARLTHPLPPSTPVHGFLAVSDGQTNARLIYIPGATVLLRDHITGVESEMVRTDLSGRFSLVPRRPGTYDLCWRMEGFQNGCAANPLTLPDQPTFLGTLQIQPIDDPSTATVTGTVRMKDGSSPRRLEPMLNVNALAQVSLRNGQDAIIRTVYVNNAGEYYMTGVPVGSAASLRAEVEGAIGTHSLYAAAPLSATGINVIDLTLDNHQPRLDPLVATDLSGQRIQTAAPGAIALLQPVATDSDSDPVTFSYVLSDESGTLSAPEGPAVTWQLPTHNGLFTVTVIARDGRGGYAKSHLTLRVSNLGVPFSGHVIGTDGPAANGATVEINGQVTTTDSDGLFLINVPQASRYVMNIRKPDYGLISRIYDDSVTSGKYRMPRASVFMQSAQQQIDIIDQRPAGNCPGPHFTEVNWATLANLANPEWQDGTGRVIPAAAPLQVPLPSQFQPSTACGPGIRVIIPPNSLVTANGTPPTGNVKLELTTIDLNTPDQVPGDYTVVSNSGQTGVLQSYGAGNIQIHAGGQTCNLAAGATATLIIPADPAQIAAGGPLPATLPLLVYDETAGVWHDQGVATLNAMNRYVATVHHFSTFNVGITTPTVACVRIVNSSSTTLAAFGAPWAMPSQFTLEVIVPQGTAAPKIVSFDVDNFSPSEQAIYNLPTNTNIVLVPTRSETECDGSLEKALGVFVVNTGGAQNPQSPSQPAGPPYSACSTKVILKNNTIPETPNSGEFLQGLDVSSFNAVNLSELDPSSPIGGYLALKISQATGDYYDQIDPTGQRLRLGGFKTVNNFDGTASRATFANSGDLGFGRDMHCQRTGDDVACYVTNYGNIDSSDCFDAFAALLQLDSEQVATVAMEYSRIEDPGGGFSDGERVVKFYAYGGGSDDSALIRSADLDGLGARPIPQLCMICHGGSFTSKQSTNIPLFNDREDVKLGSKFLPFDLQLYTFRPEIWKAVQQPTFKSFNEDIVSGTPPDTAIQDVITKMYASGSTQDENFVVSGWDTSLTRDFYRDVLGATCRTCHLGNVTSKLQFKSALDFVAGADLNNLGKAEYRICVTHEMPHAKRTHEVYWASTNPSMPASFQLFGDQFSGGAGWSGTLCNFTPGGDTPVSYYEENIQPIWNDHCTGCHSSSTSSSYAYLSLKSPSYSNIVNVPASQLSSMDRIEPNNKDHSYLWLKINGSQGAYDGDCAAVPPGTVGCGARMPYGCSGSSCLSSAELTAIEAWINLGAPEY